MVGEALAEVEREGLHLVVERLDQHLFEIGIQGAGFRVQGSGFRVQGAGCWVQGQGSGLKVEG